MKVHVIDDLPDSERRFHRLSDRLCLDLVATIGERWRRRFERLAAPTHLDRWLAEADLPSGGATSADLDQARRLRDAIEVLAIDAMAATAPTPPTTRQVTATEVATGLASVNEFAAHTPLAPALRGGQVRWEVAAGTTATGAGLAHVARDAVDLFSSSHRDRIRECGAEDCALVFVDTSRAGARRWCSMRACGNRAKVAAHRARQSGGGS